ncbi:MAG: hypothetical protein BRC33_09535 [Cyanobacteria bacterium SW_9_44_58]|nr:MAG: hypothetical protein BRC33_09535 [Cyanobacteria bacterium SW_9_44_58]
MKLTKSAQHTLISAGTALLSAPVLAHSGHFENKEETEGKNTDSSANQAESNSSEQFQTDHQSQSNTSSTKKKQSSSPNQSQKSSSEINNQTATKAVEEQSTTQAQVVTISKIPPLGETILGLIITTPFFLYALRKRIHQ